MSHGIEGVGWWEVRVSWGQKKKIPFYFLPSLPLSLYPLSRCLDSGVGIESAEWLQGPFGASCARQADAN